MTLDRLAALEAEATKGPWGVGYWSGQCNLHQAGRHPGPDRGCKYDYTLREDGDPHELVSLSEPVQVLGNYDYEQGGAVREADAALIAALRNAAPVLIEVARAARKADAEASLLHDAIYKAAGLDDAERNVMSDMVWTIHGALRAALERLDHLTSDKEGAAYCVEGHPTYVAGCSHCEWKAGAR